LTIMGTFISPETDIMGEMMEKLLSSIGTH
jgi:hypothetical protein